MIAFQEGWFTAPQEKKLRGLLAEAKKEGWAGYIRNRSDLQALLDGCWFDAERAEKVIKFMRLFTVIEGPLAGQRFEPVTYQRDLVYRLFGWIKPDARHKTGWVRRFKKAFCFIPKKNGKTVFCSAILLYMLLYDGEARPMVYAAAKDRSQAGKLWEDAADLLRASRLKPWLDSKRIEILKGVKTIDFPESGGSLRTLSADAGSADGKSAHALVIDELHVHRNDKLFKTLRYAGRGRMQPLTLIITTAGDDVNSICYKEYIDAKRVAENEVVVTDLLPMIFEAPADADLGDPKTWYAANPSLGEILSEEEMRADYEKACASPVEMNWFKRYLLNIWVDKNADQGFISGAQWSACRGEFTEEDVKDLPCYLGLDLASRDDFAALALLWRGEEWTYCRVHLWNPAEKLKDRAQQGRLPFRQWTDEGWIEASPGWTIDAGLIERRIRECFEKYKVQALIYDRRLSEAFVPQLHAEGFPTVELPQIISHLDAPTKELQRLVLDKALVHEGSPVMDWMCANVHVIADTNLGIRIAKNQSSDKVDGFAALINAVAGSRFVQAPEPSPYSRPQEERVLFL